MSPQRTIVIVGAGFSGTLVAANLLRSQHWATTRIVLIERSTAVARGKAYADREYSYLLNVPAGRMSADPSVPLDFLSFAQQRIPGATAEDFLPRALYGQYLEATLLDAEVTAPPHVHFERLCGEVCAVEKIGDSSAYRVQLSSDHALAADADGRTIYADDVVLATGNPPPATLPGTEQLQQYVCDPWAQPLRFSPGERVLLIGSGLTMVDVATAAAASSNEQAVIHAISRHGLVPPSQTQFSHSACKGDSATMLRAASFSALTLLRTVRKLADETEQRGGDWREAVTFIRNIAPTLWQRLPTREKRRLLRHVRPYWDVHRHRLPSQTLAKLTHLRSRQKLHIHAGRLLKFENVGSQVRVSWRARGADDVQTLIVDRVVNCTGPDYNVSRSQDPLIRSLLAQGLAVSDPHNLGIRTGPYGALVDAQGRAAANLFYVGPMLRADHWEATAAQELRGHAERLAGYLSAPVGRLRAAATA
ncbi:MAG: FAD/NAD(P)-binding protein [Steroidobacteraceae bacterium]